VKCLQVHSVIDHFDLPARDAIVADNLFLPSLGVGNNLLNPGRLEDPFFQEEKGAMERIHPIGPFFDPGIHLSSLNEPLPVAAVSGSINILVKGSFKTVDDIESLFLEELFGEEGKTQGLQKRGALDYGNTVENRGLLPCGGSI
jgi:hypothetical protein